MIWKIVITIAEANIIDNLYHKRTVDSDSVDGNVISPFAVVMAHRYSD